MKEHKQPGEYETRLSEEAESLNQYLNQYKYCIGNKKMLERRRIDIMKEFNYPLSAVNMDGMPKGSSTGTGCAAISFRLDEIDTRIKLQIEQAEKFLTDIMSIIDFLPENSLERLIIETRYIDNYSWERVCRENHISRSPAIRHWKKGLYQLLEFKRVKQILKDYQESRG